VSMIKLVIKLVPSPGVQVVLLPVFLVSVVVVLTALARVLLVTCAVEVACLPQLKHGVVGTAR